MRPAVFLDRDGVVIHDTGLVTSCDQVSLYDDAPAAIAAFHDAGFAVVIVSNQAAVARGLLSEEGVREIDAYISRRLVEAGASPPDGFYFCTHHPNATLPEYRVQ